MQWGGASDKYSKGKNSQPEQHTSKHPGLCTSRPQIFAASPEVSQGALNPAGFPQATLSRVSSVIWESWQGHSGATACAEPKYKVS